MTQATTPCSSASISTATTTPPTNPRDGMSGTATWETMSSDVSLPNPPSFNEDDVSDKPAWIGNTPILTPEEVDELRQRYRQRLRSLQSVDEMVGRLVGVLRQTGELSNTYIVFTSDNGLHLGEHRINKKKWTAYEEAIRVPLLVRGPGVPQGV